MDRVLKLGQTLASKNSNKIAIEFEASELTKGVGQDKSPLLCSAAASLSGGLFSPEDRSQILSLLKSKLEEQVKGFDIEVADSADLGGEKDEYSRLYLTQSVEDLGCDQAAFQAYLGFSQNDPGNLDPKDIGIAFIGSLSGKDKEELVRRSWEWLYRS